MGKNAKVEDYAGFCCKKHDIFTNPVFKNVVYLFIYLFIYLSIYLLIDFNLYLFDGLVPKTRVKKFNIFRQEFRAIRQFRI